RRFAYLPIWRSMSWFILAQFFSTLIKLVLLRQQTDRAKDLQIPYRVKIASLKNMGKGSSYRLRI
ncbi:MAG: hypothetical protein ABI700_11375, partial [Chloroflexota bacterium]